VKIKNITISVKENFNQIDGCYLMMEVSCGDKKSHQELKLKKDDFTSNFDKIIDIMKNQIAHQFKEVGDE
jgi:hypothetical protein